MPAPDAFRGSTAWSGWWSTTAARTRPRRSLGATASTTWSACLGTAAWRGPSAAASRPASAAGADVIVNLDADNQYDARDIPKLVAPILAGEAQLVVGSRPIETIAEFSLLKKLLQRLGSWVVRIASRTSVPDAPSGFRAMSREAASQLNVFSDYTYTLETIIQAGQRGMAVTSVPVRTNPALRPSRLMKGIPSYVRRSILTIVRIFMTYRPFEFFAIPGAVSLLAGLALGGRFLYYYFGADAATGHVQSVVLGALLLGLGVALIVVGLVADLISANRKLMEKTDAHLHRLRDRLRRWSGGSNGRRTADAVPVPVGESVEEPAREEESRCLSAPRPDRSSSAASSPATCTTSTAPATRSPGA